ncbi:MAG: tRNA (adenosine(37)-N6)-dimethylallyltransferase MiaA [Patescibacteria group bacterium]
MPKILAIVGPTASGKTSLGLLLAKRFDGEIVNADARQLYKEFSIGTGKPTCESEYHDDEHICWVDDVPHYLMDSQDPRHPISVAEYKALAEERIEDILSRGKLPILVGGTGLYVSAIIDQPLLPEVPPNESLRAELEKKELPELVHELLELDEEAGDSIDLQNPRRVIRAIELVKALEMPIREIRKTGEPKYDALQLAIKHESEALRERIDKTIDRFFAEGWMQEVRGLLTKDIPFDVPAWSSIGYPELRQVLEGKLTESEAKRQIQLATWHYAKRQLTWFKRDQRIKWLATDKEAINEAIKFLAT